MEVLKINSCNKEKSYFYYRSNEEAYIFMILGCGCNNEKGYGNGIAHIVEHISLSYCYFTEEEYFINDDGYKIDPKDYIFSGYTSFNHTVIAICTKNRESYIRDAILLLKHIIRGDTIKDYILRHIGHDVLEEYSAKKDGWEIQKNIISYITNGVHNSIPIGDLTYINNFEENDIRKFIYENYYCGDIGIVVMSKLDKELDVSNILNRGSNRNNIEEIKRMELKRELTNKKINNMMIYKENNSIKKMNIYFHIKKANLTLKEQLIRTMIEKILSKNIEKEFSKEDILLNSIEISDKYIDAENYFFVIKLVLKNLYNNITKLSGLIQRLEKKIYVEEVEILKVQLKKEFKEINSEDSDKVNEILIASLNNFLYGYEIVLIKEKYEIIKNAIDTITVNDINSNIRAIITDDYKIVFM